MPEVEVTLPDRIESDIERLVDDGEFLNRERAIEELLSMGVSAYDTTDEPVDDVGEDVFDRATSEQQDPAARGDEPDDRPTF